MKQEDGIVHLIDDDEAMLASLTMYLKSTGLACATYRSAEQFVKESGWQSGWDRPGCVVLDLRMPGMGGERLLAHLAERPPMPEVIVLTAHGSIESAVRSIKAGAVQFLRKPCSSKVLREHVVAAIEADRTRLRAQRRSGELRRRLGGLTPRERDVVGLLTEGLSSAEIARRLGIKTKSIEIYRSNILTKLGAASSAELISTLLKNRMTG